MKISSVRIRQFEMQRLDPTYRTASFAAGAAGGFLLEITAGGVTGIGGTAAHPVTIQIEDLAAQLSGPVRKVLLGADPLAGNLIRLDLKRMEIHPRGRLAADLALYDLLGKLANLPCHAFWGGMVRSKVKVIRMVGIKSPDQLVAAVRPIVDQGFRHFKVKIGTGIPEDVERLRALRQTFGNDLWIGVDANSAYTPEEAIELARSVQGFGVRLIEQPTDDKDVDGLARVTAASPIPIMSDRAMTDLQSALAVCQKKAAHIVSIKATAMGSLEECRQIYELCQAFGMRVHFGGSVTSAVADIATAQLAGCLPGAEEECEVGEFLGVKGDPIRGVPVRDGCIEPSAAPGWGVHIDPEFTGIDI